MLYLQLFSLNLLNELSEHLGSDGVMPMDERKTTRTIREWAEQHTFPKHIVAYQLRSTGKGFTPYHNQTPILLTKTAFSSC